MLPTPKENIPRTLVKRAAPFGIVGTLSKSLFGTLDQDDAEYFNTQIDRLYADQANLTHLIGRQTHLIASKIQDLHQEHEEETKRVHDLRVNVVQLQREIQLVNKISTQVQYNTSLINYALRVENKIDRYIAVSEHYLHIIAAARNELYEPTILTTEQLLSVAREVQIKASMFEFPLSLEYLRGETLARIARADVIYHGGRVIIVTHIPLLDRTVYYLYRLHAWPVMQNVNNETGSAHVTPAAPYVALSADHRTYFHADRIDIQSCTHVDQKSVCAMEIPVHEVAVTESCEILMLTAPTVDAYRRCNVRLRPRHDPFWAHLPTQGGWLYSFAQTENVHIICSGQQDQHIVLTGAGVLYINPNCIGKTRSTTLTGILTYKNREEYFYRPDISLNVTIIAPTLTATAELHMTPIANNERKQGGTNDVIRDWRTPEDGESLYEVEERLKAIGTHQRERQQQRSLFVAGFSAQAAILAAVALYMCRSQIIVATLGLARASRCRVRASRRSSVEGPAIRNRRVNNPEAGIELPPGSTVAPSLNTTLHSLPPQIATSD